ncbi:MAG: ABC transporter ATP-binding protein [Candidatus Paceibacterota bacterium]
MEDKKEKSNVKYSRIFYYFWRETKGYRTLTIFSVISIAFGTILGNVIEPKMYQKIIDSISSLPYPSFSKELSSSFTLLVTVLVANFIFWRINEYLQSYTQSKIIKRLTDLSYKSILIHSRRFFANSFTGGLIAKSGRFINSFEQLYDIIVWNFFGPILGFTGIIFVLSKESKTLVFIFVVWFFIFLIISYFFAKYQAPFEEERAKASTEVRSLFADSITNILSIKIFSAFKNEVLNFKDKTNEEESKRTKSWFLGNTQNLIRSFLIMVLEIGGLYFAIRLWSEGSVSVGFVVLVQIYMSRIFNYISSIGWSIRRFTSSLSDAKEMVEILDQEIDIKDPENPEKCEIKNGNIVFENVSFEYKEGKDVFENFNLEIASGQKVGIVGHSGSGKTTITNLLLRFEDVTSGFVKIDGQDIRNITQDDLRRNISYVPQEPVLFHRTLKENISYGNPEASEREIEVASKKAHAEEFIKDLKDGYETMVGERGVKLSGGQRQRIAIARVMLENSPILILDEATSSLDSISENLIQKAFDEAMKNRTTIVIAHRLSTIKKMDRIIVLDKGKIVEDGTHDDLLNKKGYYFKLWQAQKDGVI